MHFSIDLDAELKKITRKQHLNSVHFLIQLLRHALTHNPQEVVIESERRRLVLEQNGRCFQTEEWNLLKQITNPVGGDDEQQALTQLEKKYGVSVLSLALNFPHMSLRTGEVGLVSENGRITFSNYQDHVQGYRVELTRQDGDPKEELKELEFYGSGSLTPVYFNGTTINRPIEFGEQILVTRFESEHGHGAVGIPVNGELCSVVFYKNGVRLGMKQFVPMDGRVFHGFWNSSLNEFESDYNQTIRTGDYYLQHYRDQIYTESPQHFGSFTSDQKKRMKKILLSLDIDDWETHYGELPLFHSAVKNFGLSLNDLLKLERQYEGIPYVTASQKQLPAYVPRLSSEDLLFFGQGRGHTLKLVLHQEGRRLSKKIFNAKQVLSDADLSTDQKHFLSALNGAAPFENFYFTKSGSGLSTDKNDYHHFYLDLRNQEVTQAMKNWREHPYMLRFLRYRLMGLATG